MRQSAAAPLLILVFVITACAPREAQRAVQAGLNVLAAGVAAATDASAEAHVEPADAARARVHAERAACQERPTEECPEHGDVDAWLSRYDSLLDSWGELSEGLHAARLALYGTQAALNLWVRSGELPSSPGPFCAELETAFEALGGLLERVGVPVPAAYTGAAGAVDIVCNTVMGYLAEED